MRGGENVERNYTPAQYLAARPFLERLKLFRPWLPSEQYKAIKDRALSGDIRGAEAELARIERPRGWR